MGNNMAQELAAFQTRESALYHHLTANHYPPVPPTMVQPCSQAIDAYWEEDYDRLIELPDGVTWRGNSSAPANAIIEAHHLDAWLQDYE